MFFIIITWVYIAAIFYLYGSMCIDIVRKVVGSPTTYKPHFTTVGIAGMAFTALLSVIICLVLPLNLTAHLILLVIALGYWFMNRGRIKDDLHFYFTEARKSGILIKILFFSFLFTTSFISSLPSSHYDDGLYYSSSIKWLQDYGTVPGLANVNPRIAFNSMWLILQSMFSFPFQPWLLNDLNGLLYMFVFIYSLQGLNKLLQGQISRFTVLQAVFFVPALGLHFSASHDFLLYNINFFTSPSPDVSASFISWYVFLMFINRKDAAAGRPLSEALILIFIGFLLTIKLSTIPIALLAIPILWNWLKEKRFRLAGVVITLNLLTVIPWLIRNVILSGYILFPFSKLDLFNVDWKIAATHVNWHENAVRIWAINPEYPLDKELSVPFSVWFPDWFERLTYIQSVVIILIVLFTGIFFLSGIYQVIRKRGFLKENAALIMAVITCLTGVLFWFYKGPDLRLGFGFNLFYCMIGLALFIHFFIDSFPKQLGLFLAGFTFFVFFTGYFSIWSNAPLKKMTAGLYRNPVPTEKNAVALSPSINLHLMKNETCHYCELPCTMEYEYNVLHPVLRGKTLKEGFKPKPE